MVAVICCSLVACGNKVDNLIEEIATLENDEITLADEERIDKIYDKYFALSEEDKAKITNYNILKEASAEVNRLVQTKETMQCVWILLVCGFFGGLFGFLFKLSGLFGSELCVFFLHAGVELFGNVGVALGVAGNDHIACNLGIDAGGIVSAAVDGIKCAHAVLDDER